MARLAVNGGIPVRTQPWPPWPVVGPEEEANLLAALRSRRWFAGFLGADVDSWVGRFERAFAAFQGTQHGVAVVNGTAALEIALRSAGVKAGDEVVVPAFTFVATVSAVLQLGAVPVVVDIEEGSYGLDPEAAEAAITERTRAMVVVHYGGQIAEMERLGALAERHGLVLIEDAAHAHGSERWGRRAGQFGRAATFSFQESKTVTAGEGGVILTDDPTLAGLARSYRSNGRQPGRPGYEHHRLGWNYRMHEFQGAVLAAQMERAEAQVRQRTAMGRLLTTALQGVPGFSPVADAPGTTRNGHYLYLVRCEEELLERASIDRIIAALEAEGIPADRGYLPVPRSPMFQPDEWEEAGLSVYSRLLPGRMKVHEARVPRAERAFETLIELPHNLLLGDRSDLNDVVEAFGRVSEARDEL